MNYQGQQLTLRQRLETADPTLIRKLITGTLTPKQIAEQTGENREAIKGLKRRLIQRARIPSHTELIEKPPVLQDQDWQRWMYAADFHVPLHSERYVDRLLTVAQQRSIDKLIVGGDFFDFGSSSRHPKTDRTSSIEDTVRIGGNLLLLLLETFNTIWLLRGNHDARVAAQVGEPFSLESLIHMGLSGQQAKGTWCATDYEWLDVGRYWRVGHPHSYSKQASKIESDIVLQSGRHVIGAHTHLQGVSVIGTHERTRLAITPGCMTDARYTPYVMRRLGMSRYPAWVQGFVAIDNSIPTLYGDLMTDWKVIEG